MVKWRALLRELVFLECDGKGVDTWWRRHLGLAQSTAAAPPENSSVVSVEAAPIYVVVGDILLRGRRATIVKLSSRAGVEVRLCASERACGETATLQLRPAEGHWRFMVVG